MDNTIIILSIICCVVLILIIIFYTIFKFYICKYERQLRNKVKLESTRRDYI